MKKLILLILSLLLTSLLIADEPFTYVAPDFLHSFYDSYSKNYQNAFSAGMVSSGAARVKSTYNMHINPATLYVTSQKMYMEYFQKSSARELNDANTKNYKNHGVTGFVSYSMPITNDFHTAFSISTPQTLKYESFSRFLEDNYVLKREPKIMNLQYMLSTSYHFNNLHLGLNVIMNNYLFQDYRYIVDRDYEAEEVLVPEFNRIDFDTTTIRFQPGLVYEFGNKVDGKSFGFSFMPKTEADFDAEVEEYSTTLPSLYQFGFVNYNKGKILQLDFEYERTSEQSDAFDDRYKVKLGLEKQYKSYSLRGGFAYVSSIFEGNYIMPQHPEIAEESRQDNEGSGGTGGIEDDIDWSTEGKIKNQAQYLASFGYTQNTFLGDIHFAIIKDFNETTLIEIMMGFETDFRFHPKYKKK